MRLRLLSQAFFGLSLCLSARPLFAFEIDKNFGDQGRLVLPIDQSNWNNIFAAQDGFLVVSASNAGYVIQKFDQAGKADASFTMDPRLADELLPPDYACDQRLYPHKQDGEDLESYRLIRTCYSDGAPAIVKLYNLGHNGGLDLVAPSGVTITAKNFDRVANVIFNGDRMLVFGINWTMPAPDGRYGIWVNRYYLNGTQDGQFGKDGVLDPVPDATRTGIVSTLDDDGHILVATNVSKAEVNYVDVARFNADGSVDTAFGDQGLVEVAFPEPTSSDLPTKFPFAEAMRASSGRITVAINVQAHQGNRPDYKMTLFMYRFDHDGKLDASFGTGGVAEMFETGASTAFYDILAQVQGGDDFLSLSSAGSNVGNAPFLGVFDAQSGALVAQDTLADLQYYRGAVVTTDDNLLVEYGANGTFISKVLTH